MQIPATVNFGGTNTKVFGIDSYAFAYCSNLKEVSLPAGMVIISSYAFKGSNICSLVLPQGLGSLSENALADCPALEYVDAQSVAPTFMDLGVNCFNSPKLQTIQIRHDRPVTTARYSMFTTAPQNLYVDADYASEYKSATFVVSNGSSSINDGKTITNPWSAVPNIVGLNKSNPTLSVTLTPKGGVVNGGQVYQSFYSPLAVSLPAGLRAFTAENITTEEVKVMEITSTVPAFTPVLLMGEAGKSYTLGVHETSSAYPERKLKASPISANYTETDNVWVLAYRNNETVPAFYRMTGKLEAGIVYVNATSSSLARLSINGIITGITTAEAPGGSTATFDLQGKKASASTKGLVIRNGKKFIQ